MSAVRFAMIGGFLGAGKTTLLAQIARRYIEAGKRVAIVTNDQAADLVDTAHLRSLGFDVGEVAGACFCCSFDELIEAADSLSADKIPDVVLAEPVGSCTDLVATIIRPMQQMLGDRFEVAPYGVLLKPSHGKLILATTDQRSGFSPQAEYIFRKQLEEADYLMIGRSDTLSDDEIQTLKDQLAQVAPDVPVVAVSPMSGQNVDQVLGYIESPMAAGSRVLDIDYDVYAQGEAELGWVNLTAVLDVTEPLFLDDAAKQIVQSIGEAIAGGGGEIAHLKVSVSGSDSRAVANLVATGQAIDVGLQSGRQARGPIELVVNARVAMDPQTLENAAEDAIEQLAKSTGSQLRTIQSRNFRPGRPVPTHRVG